MTQILDPLPSSCSGSILCCYVNSTNQIQVARVTNIAAWYFERVVFPGQRLLFEAPIDSQLEIHMGTLTSAVLSDRLACKELQVREE
jgi:hypothetical protein